MSYKMIDNLKSNDFNKSTQFHAQYNFDEYNLPKKPKPTNNDNYVTELNIYTNQMQEYFTSYSSNLHDIYKKSGSLNDKCKNAYYKLYDDFKSYQKYVRKVKANYDHINQDNLNQIPEDGSMSPSNPCFTIFSDDAPTTLDNATEKLNLLDDNFSNIFLENIKDLRRYLRKEKRKAKVKKLTKNQRKKLKKKFKSQEEKKICVEQHFDNENIFCEDPQIMIMKFFDQYLSTGEWSWTQWNRCISRIQQNIPQWFDLFSQYSCSMGINWDEMFKSDVQAIDMTNVRIDIASLDESNKLNPIPSLNEFSKEGTSVIFTDDVVIRDPNELSGNDLYCDACSQEFKSRRAFHIHLRGVKHIQNEIKYVSAQKPEKFIEEINKENASILYDINKEDKHMKWLLTNDDIAKETGSFTCKICEVTCSSQKDFQTHLNGDKHKANSSAASVETGATSVIGSQPSTGNSSRSDTNNNTSSRNPTKTFPKHHKKPVAKIQIFLNQCTHALIGLNYINEYQKRDVLHESWYYCELCTCKLDRKSIIGHIISFKHRESYLKQNYYDLYELIEQDPSSKAVRSKRLEVFSEQIEIFEGRKTMNIMMEKQSSSLPECSSTIGAENGSADACPLAEKRKRKADVTDANSRKSKSNKIRGVFVSDRESDSDDREDGEIETSDDDSPSNPLATTKTATKVAPATPKNPKPESLIAELEAGEIENEAIDNDDDSEDSCSEETVKTVPDQSEFDNYEPLYINERLPLNTRDISRDSCRIEFLRHNRDRKKIKLKEVSDDILNHFKQEAVWALNRLKQATTPSATNNSSSRTLLLPSSKQPVGPIYPGVSEFTGRSSTNAHQKSAPTLSHHHHHHSNSVALSPELEFTNIIDKIESLTGKELTTNRVRGGKCNSNDKTLLCDVQNMLVNKTINDKLNEMVRKELLLDASFDVASSKVVKKSILDNPLDIRVLNETVEMVRNLSDMIYQTPDADAATLTNHQSLDMLASHQLAGYDQSPSKLMLIKHLENTKMGDKISKRAEFLGVDQPLPPNFPKLNSNIYFKQQNFNMLPNPVQMIPAFMTPGMIEHQAAFSNYSSHFMYQYPLLFPNSSSVSRLSSEISNSHNRTNL